MKKNYREGRLRCASNYKRKDYFGIGEIIQLLIVIFLFAILSVVIYKTFTEVNNDIQADPDMGALPKAKLDDLHSRFPATFDGAFLTIFALLFILGVVASLLFDSHPVFFIVIILIMAFLMVASGFISNSWAEFMDDDELSTYQQTFPISNWFMDNLLLVMGVSASVFGSIIYFKRRV